MTANTAPRDAYQLALVKVNDLIAPKSPVDIETAGIEETVLTDLLMRISYSVSRFTTEWICKQMQVSPALGNQLLEKLCFTGLIEQLWQTSDSSSHYKITEQGREHAHRLMEVCSYIGPAPVSMEAYAAMLRWQFSNTPPVTNDQVSKALSSLVLAPRAAQLAGLAVSSGRSLFVYGPSGNGKSSLGRQIHAAIPGDYWIPYAISVGDSVIRLYDAHIHHRVEGVPDKPDIIDPRWIRVRRPLVIVGGELTLDLLDLIYVPSIRCYEAPPHLKANGGTFLVDDFGRERVTPEQLLNRFITPMEHQIDYFTLRTGQKVQLPLRHVLIIATNLSPDKVTDPAFLRRMGYRLYLGHPTPDEYRRIFKSYAEKHGVVATDEMLDKLLERYHSQGRELRACEPRDLIERCRDICRFENKELEISPATLDLAWSGYFGEM